jgi:hypothetical protein
MNSDNLQQSTSTMTIYNSGFFDEASIMRILDKTLSDDDLYDDDLDFNNNGPRGTTAGEDCFN